MHVLGFELKKTWIGIGGMKIQGTHYQTIWMEEGKPEVVYTFDQRLLPFEIRITALRDSESAARAIEEMLVRGAPLIGATAGYAMYLAVREAAADASGWPYILARAARVRQTRPTAVDLFHAVDRVLDELDQSAPDTYVAVARATADAIASESVAQCQAIGTHGLELIRRCSEEKGAAPVQILTHCNAGWLACVDYGTATAPIYAAHDAGIPVHVWVDETRPRNQGSKLTAFELAAHGVPHTVIADNTGGHLMQHGMVDMVIVGTDRTTRQGDVANKIGTYLKALAARDNGIPFYVALPGTTLDFSLRDGVRDIPIEERDADEVAYIWGEAAGVATRVRILPEASPVANYGFDVTPARLVSALITDRGICEASEAGILGLFPEKKEV